MGAATSGGEEGAGVARQRSAERGALGREGGGDAPEDGAGFEDPGPTDDGIERSFAIDGETVDAARYRAFEAQLEIEWELVEHEDQALPEGDVSWERWEGVDARTGIRHRRETSSSPGFSRESIERLPD